MPNTENSEHIRNEIRISVAMASYNGERFIEEQIDSILACLGENDEIVISDDGSTDRTIDIVKAKMEADKRILLFDGPKSGVVRNFENALKNCRGEYIFLSDQDDIWHTDKVAVVLPQLKDNILVCHNANIYNNSTKTVEGDIQNKIGCRTTVFKNIIKNSFMGCCMAFQRELLDFALPFPDKNLIHIHDWWLGLIALKVGNVYFEKNCLIDYRIHGSNTLGFNKTSLFFKIRKRINMLKALKRYRIESSKENIQ